MTARPGGAATVVICDSRQYDDATREIFAQTQHALAASGIRLVIEKSWSDDCAAAEFVICVDPIADHDALAEARLLGQKTLTRFQAQQIAEQAGMPVARFGSPSDDTELTALARDWGELAVLKYDWSANLSGVFLWPLVQARKPFPSDFRAGADLFMEFIDHHPETYKIETFGGTVLGSWMLPTRSMRAHDWQTLDASVEWFEPPLALRQSCEAIGHSLLRLGVGHASFDLMRSADNYQLVELNICGIGKSAWKRWPKIYASTYSKAIVATFEQREIIPRYRDIRAVAIAAGNENEPAVVIEKERLRTAVPGRDAAAGAELSFHRTLMETERLASDRLIDFMQRCMAKLLLHAFDTVVFYRDRLSRVVRSDRNIEWRRWNSIPLTSRKEIVGQQRELLSRNVPTHHGLTRRARSAGVAGERIVVSQSALQLAAISCMEARLYRWHGIDPGAEMATLWPGVHGDLERDRTWAPNWLPQPHGRDYRGDGTASPLEQLRWLATLGPVYLRTRASLVRSLALAVRENPELKPELRGILTRGEILTEDHRRLCARYLGHRPIDTYVLTEAGPVALSCPTTDLYHLQSDVCMVEVCRDDGLPCGRGEIGQIVVTPFYNFAMPILRYATGDFAELPPTANSCACGMNLPTIRRVVGRHRNMIQIAGRRPFQPDLDSEILWDTIGAAHWQLAQIGPHDLELRFVSDRPDQALRLAEAKQHLDLATGSESLIRFTRMQTIPTHGGKFEFIVCEPTPPPG